MRERKGDKHHHEANVGGCTWKAETLWTEHGLASCPDELLLSDLHPRPVRATSGLEQVASFESLCDKRFANHRNRHDRTDEGEHCKPNVGLQSWKGGLRWKREGIEKARGQDEREERVDDENGGHRQKRRDEKHRGRMPELLRGHRSHGKRRTTGVLS